MPRMRALGSWRTSQRGLGALHHALRGSSFAPGGASRFALPWDDVADFERSGCRTSADRSRARPQRATRGGRAALAPRPRGHANCRCRRASARTRWRRGPGAPGRPARGGRRRCGRRPAPAPARAAPACAPLLQPLPSLERAVRSLACGPHGAASRGPGAGRRAWPRGTGSGDRAAAPGAWSGRAALGRPELAADAVSGTHPEVGGRVVGELGSQAAPIVERMAPDDAAAALRHIEAEDRHEVLERMATDSAGELRQLLSYPPATAGALMSPDPLTAPVGSDAESCVSAWRLARPASRPWAPSSSSTPRTAWWASYPPPTCWRDRATRCPCRCSRWTSRLTR